MGNLVELFTNNLLPIIIIASIGFVLRRYKKVDPRIISQLVFYVLLPALIFRLLVTTTLDAAAVVKIMTSAAIVIGVIIALSWLITRLLPITSSQASALIMAAAFMNAGNFGLSLNQFAFGIEALAFASIFYITSSVLNNSLGVYIAKVEQSSIKQSLLNLLTVPAIYAIIAAVIIRGTGWSLPVQLWRSIDLLATAAVPLMLLLLGMQIGRGGLPRNWGLVGLLGLVVFLRLLVSPLIALLIMPILGLGDVAQKAVILEAATPTAVLTGVLAVKFDLEPDFVVAAILITTILSPLTITLLLYFLSSPSFN